MLSSQREELRDALGGPLLQLTRSGRPATPGEQDLDTLVDPVAEPALAALLALLVGDVLPSTALAALYAPLESEIPLDTVRRA